MSEYVSEIQFIGIVYRGSEPRVHPKTGEPITAEPGERIVFIYGLFSDDGRCRYVGQTVNPYRRFVLHRRKRSRRKLKMKVFRYCVADSDRIEKQIVFAYRKRKQCDLNKRNHFKPTRSKFGRRVLWSERNLVFASVRAAAEHFNCSPQTIVNRIRKPATSLDGTLSIIP